MHTFNACLQIQQQTRVRRGRGGGLACKQMLALACVNTSRSSTAIGNVANSIKFCTFYLLLNELNFIEFNKVLHISALKLTIRVCTYVRALSLRASRLESCAPVYYFPPQQTLKKLTCIEVSSTAGCARMAARLPHIRTHTHTTHKNTRQPRPHQ
jgi:hypothetical protein